MELTKENQELVDGLNKKIETLTKEIDTAKEVAETSKENKIALTQMKELLEANQKELEAVKSAGQEQGNKINEIEAMKQTEEFKTFTEQLKAQLTENMEALKAFKDHSNPNNQLQLKAAGNMTTGNVGTTTYSLSRTIEPGLTDILGIDPLFETYCNVAPTNSSRIVYAEKKNRDGSTVFISEAAAKTKIDFDIVESESVARKVASYIKVSEEMLTDVDYIAAEITNELAYEVNLEVSEGIIAGDGIAPNLGGITTLAPAYGLTTILTTTPNTFDAIQAAATQIVTNNGRATHVFLNPIDYTNMGIAKGTTGYYVVIDGMVQMLPYLIVQSNQITVGEIIVGDMSKVIVRNLEAFRAEFGYDSDDWTKNMVTVRGERRVHMFIKSNHTPCFVYDDISDIITAITTP